MAFAKINGIDLYYEVHGEGPAVVFGHGAGGSHLSWWQQVPALSRSFRCITFDHRGFGLSREPAGGPGARQFVEDLRGLLDHLGIESAALVGQSMGGWSVLGFAAAYPHRTRAVVLCDTPAGIDDEAVSAEFRRLHEGAPRRLNDVLTQAFGAELARSDPARAFLYREISALNFEVPAGLISALSAVRTKPDVIVERRIPTMLIVGEEDALTPPALIELVYRRLPHARFVRVRGAGHSVYFERPAEFNQMLENFLRESLG